MNHDLQSSSLLPNKLHSACVHHNYITYKFEYSSNPYFTAIYHRVCLREHHRGLGEDDSRPLLRDGAVKPACGIREKISRLFKLTFRAVWTFVVKILSHSQHDGHAKYVRLVQESPSDDRLRSSSCGPCRSWRRAISKACGTLEPRSLHPPSSWT